MRELEAKMLFWLDERLKNNGIAQDAIKRKSPREVFVYAMEACVGIREHGGNNAGPLVELIQKTIGGANFEPWCMALVQTCLAYAEERTGRKSPIVATEHCLTAWNDSPAEQRVKRIPARGAIIIWRHGSTTNGHTGCVIETDGVKFSAVEGNTESGIVGGRVERDGGGVYRTIRSHSGNGDMRVVGFLKPF